MPTNRQFEETIEDFVSTSYFLCMIGVTRYKNWRKLHAMICMIGIITIFLLLVNFLVLVFDYNNY